METPDEDHIAYEEISHDANHTTKTFVYVPTEPEKKRFTFEVDRGVLYSFAGTALFALAFLLLLSVTGYRTVLFLKDEV